MESPARGGDEASHVKRTRVTLSRFIRPSVFSPNRASTLRRRRAIKTEEEGGRAAPRRAALLRVASRRHRAG